jgi:hypothetical protein
MPPGIQPTLASIFAQLSFSPTVRLNTGRPGWLSGSAAK